MPRDSNGNYTLPAGNPVIANTVIEADGWGNPTLDDLAAAMTSSLSRDGQGGMLAPFLNQDGTMANPGMSWANEPTAGWYRKAPGEFWYSVAGVDIFGIAADGITLAPGLDSTGINVFITVQDAQPAGMKQGESWYKSNDGQLIMRYVNPDFTETLVSLVAAGGDFLPQNLFGAPDGVATLNTNGIVVADQNYPIGSVFTNADGADPSFYFGGAWSISGTQVVGADTITYWKRTA